LQTRSTTEAKALVKVVLNLKKVLEIASTNNLYFARANFQINLFSKQENSNLVPGTKIRIFCCFSTTCSLKSCKILGSNDFYKLYYTRFSEALRYDFFHNALYCWIQTHKCKFNVTKTSYFAKLKTSQLQSTLLDSSWHQLHAILAND